VLPAYLQGMVLSGTVGKDYALVGRLRTLTKVAGVYPFTRAYGSPKQEGMYTTLLMSTGLSFGTEVETEAMIECSRKDCHDIQRPLHAAVGSKKTSPRFEVVTGHPCDQIVCHEQDWRADLIIVGHRGRTFLDRLLIGSVAGHVINHAPCAVLVAC